MKQNSTERGCMRSQPGLYEYAAPVSSRIMSSVFSLKIFPEPTLRKDRTDYFGNEVCLFSVQEVHHKLDIITQRRVTVHPKNYGRRRPRPLGKMSRAFFVTRSRRKSWCNINSSSTLRRCARRWNSRITR